MGKKTVLLMVLIFFMCFSAANAADYRFTYKKGKVDAAANSIKTGKDSAFAISYGAACEVRCGPGSLLEINAVTKTGESVFTLKAGSCFVRIIDDGAAASVTLNTPFVVMKSRDAAFYAGCGEKAASVYDGSARIEFNGRMAKLTAGRMFKDGKIWENQPGEDAWKEWNFYRDKIDIFLKLQSDKNQEEKIKKVLTETAAKGYCAGKNSFIGEPEPQDFTAAIKIEAKNQEFFAAGPVGSEAFGVAGVVNLNKKINSADSAYESAAFLPFMYETAAAILRVLEQAEAQAIKKGRKVIIEAEGLPETDILTIEKAVRALPGFISVNNKKYYNIKVVFETMLYGTGYDIIEAINKRLKKSNINVWKYSKNIVKLRVVKVEH